MILRNFSEADVEVKPSHQGRGNVRNALLYTAEDFASSLRFLYHVRIEAGDSIGYHTHGENEEMYVVLEGEGQMCVNGELRRVRSGDCILNKAGWSHGLENDTDHPLILLVFEAEL